MFYVIAFAYNTLKHIIKQWNLAYMQLTPKFLSLSCRIFPKKSFELLLTLTNNNFLWIQNRIVVSKLVSWWSSLYAGVLILSYKFVQKIRTKQNVKKIKMLTKFLAPKFSKLLVPCTVQLFMAAFVQFTWYLIIFYTVRDRLYYKKLNIYIYVCYSFRKNSMPFT